MTPRVSVIITAYNNEPFVETAIRSILAQDYQDFELVVVEDRGRDRTYEIAKRFEGDRVRVIRNTKNLGQHVNKNEGIRHARGELLKFVDADDYILPGALRHLVDMYDSASPRVGAVFALPSIIDEHSRKICDATPWGFVGRANGPAMLHYLATAGNKGSCLCNVTPHLFARDVLERVGCFPGSNPYAGDWETFLKLLAVGDVIFTDAHVAAYRIQSQSVSKLTPILPQAKDGIRSTHEVATFVASMHPGDQRFNAHAFRSGLLDSFVDRYVHPQRLRSMLGRPNCYAELRDLFAAEGLQPEFHRMVSRGFVGYIARTVRQKTRAAVGLSPYTPALAGFRPST